MNGHVRRLKPTELSVRVLLLNIRVVCSLANPLKKISLRQTRGDSLRKVEELSLAVLAANWGPHLLSFESCTQEIYYSVGYLSSTQSPSEYLKIVIPAYELWVGRVIQAQELLEKVEKEKALNSVR
jgi:hypothetical protein